MTTQVKSFHCKVTNSEEAGAFLGREIRAHFCDLDIDALVVFASSTHRYPSLLKALDEHCNPKVLVGCSSAGEFSHAQVEENSVSVMAISSDTMHFYAHLESGLRENTEEVASRLAHKFSPYKHADCHHRSALILTDALAGGVELLIEQLTLCSSAQYQLFGGGAGDDGHFEETQVFLGTEAYSDSVVALEILSQQKLGISVRHGWVPGSAPMRVTHAEGPVVYSINATAATEVFKDYAQQQGYPFDPECPMPFFLQNIVGIKSNDQYHLRVPLKIQQDGGVVFAAEVPVGATISIMTSEIQSVEEAAKLAAKDAMSQVKGKPAHALFFDCVATRLRAGGDFDKELQSVQEELKECEFVGCNTYGQIARVDGQFEGFHNCTAVVCTIPSD
ncbi:FIST signal transduction protein [Pleionea sp. CnH1-48]|uniref:FIST signal transduction protein n=1 Tax=Pleionea sp. CnH1-48 TaxID=2954494 RepID=UPI0020985A2A|nr:FIST N-terminal domain-containing protein [Pleionea sp. CnH1-48]MCO7223481.1 FIST C-terminal domain-containing protein [Pleionea sp. CnH1-48]